MCSKDWQWLYDSGREQLMLAMGTVSLELTFARRWMQLTIPESSAFDTEDATHFNRIRDYLNDYSPLSANDQLQATIHATAGLRFLKPTMPQSWHFRFADTLESWPQAHWLCRLDSGLDCCEFLIIEQDDRSSLCLLLNDSMRLSPTKKIRKFECIRVLNDRLHEHSAHPLPQHWQNDWSSLA